jgi:3-oxoacyl-[acyl-carrier protein] reductase
VRALDGRSAIVTGGAGGVGGGIASVLARCGAGVMIADLDLAAAEALAERLRGDGHVARALAVDLVDRDSADAMAAAAVGTWGGVDILVANAGIYPEVRVEELSDEQLDRILDLNLKGAVHSVQACLPAMTGRGYGRIVLTSSITGPLVGAPGYAAYGASKAAMLGLMRGLALEVADSGITVNAILPGNVRSKGFEDLDETYRRQILAAIPLKRLAEPEELGWAVRYLASEEAGYVTGQTLVLDGGQVLPEGAF